MTSIADTPRRKAPPLQRYRIATLRVLFAAAAVPILLGASQWSGAPATALHVAGVLCVVAAVLGRFWAILYIGGRKDAGVMQDGPYSVCRHPLYLASTLGVIGFGLLLGSLVLAAGLGGMVWLVLSRTARHEEAHLRARFGAAYDAYAARVPRMRPDPRLFRTPAEVTFSVAQLRRNLADAMVFLATIPLAGAINLMHGAGVLHGFPLY